MVRVDLRVVGTSIPGQCPLQALSDLYNSQDAAEDSELQPARKRRRLDHDQSASRSSTIENTITLAEIEIILNCAAAGIGEEKIAGGYCSNESVPVLLKASRTPGTFTISRVSERTKSSVILCCDSNITSPHFRNVLAAGSYHEAGARVKRTNIAWSECRLIRPTTSHQITLHAKLKWVTGVSCAFSKPHKDLTRLLQAYLPASDFDATDLSPHAQTQWAPKDFYDNVHVPDPSVKIPSNIQSSLVQCQLYPFQKRAVQWLLRREGVEIDERGIAVDRGTVTSVMPLSFQPAQDAEGQTCFVSHVLGQVQTLSDASEMAHERLKGGILSEEMGLGKTLELISLICLHRRRIHTNGEVFCKIRDEASGSELFASPATLIITPPGILEQWMKELRTRAPSLKVLHYEGVKESRIPNDLVQIMKQLLHQDVVVTTYAVLSKEIYYAQELPDRHLRGSMPKLPRRSPLIQIQWWRVCLDEAQMVESGVSKAAIVARLIPRCNAWAVTGTPLRRDIQDLLGLLIFLRYEPFCLPEIWKRMIAGYKDVFREIFETIAIRHTKSKVYHELRLPSQKRVVITIPFTAIEEQQYADVFQQMCDDCGLDKDGAPTSDEWDPDSNFEKMRIWLIRLRQTCLHPEIGQRNRRALGRKEGPLRTVEEVLEVMIDQNETAVRSEERAVAMAQLNQAHILSFVNGYAHRALERYLEALECAKRTVQACRERLVDEERKLQIVAADEVGVDKGELTSDAEDDSGGRKSRINMCKQRLRAALEVQHICSFFAATAYHNCKNEPHVTDKNVEMFREMEEQETALYEQAKLIRQELLQDNIKKTRQFMQNVAQAQSTKFVQTGYIEHTSSMRGIQSRRVTESVEELRRYLNAQAKQYEEWRGKLVECLLARLVDQDEDYEMTGEEYELSTKQQDEQFVWMNGLNAIWADRYCMVTGIVNLNVNKEMKDRLEQALDGRGFEEGRGHAPELMIKVLGIRDTLMSPLLNHDGLPVSIRGLIAEVRSLLTAVRWQAGDKSLRAAAEASFLEEELLNLQHISAAQTKALALLEKELDLFRSTMNQRVEFYRQLQHISDTVAPFQEEMSETVDQNRLDEEIQKEARHAEKLASLETKQRFLIHLRTESSGNQPQHICVICQCHFEIGVLTVCGHQYCKECLLIWWKSRRNCPTCKRSLKSSDFHDITYKPKQIQVQEELNTSNNTTDFESTTSSSPISSPGNFAKTSIYSDISATTLAEIKSIDLSGPSYGTKIDTLTRHLLWLREHDPGAKSVIFSQFRDFLEVLGRAFKHFHIGFAEIGSKKNGIQKFMEDPSTETFLLHAKADSSGLNLVNATHVFLGEPLINTSIELQAIARIHRIGQHRPTTVWMYLVSDTVEEAIYEISVERRMAHMQRRAPTASMSRSVTPALLEESTLDEANSAELQSAAIPRLLMKGASGGEVVDKEDLWRCLFKKTRKEHSAVACALEDDPLGREVSRHLRAEAAEHRAFIASGSGP